MTATASSPDDRPSGPAGVPPARFPEGFLWGAATSAYQIEGAVRDDGRGRSVWDDFCDEPGRIVDGSSGAVAVDHRHRMDEDVELMGRLGLDAYRFSVSWPRVQPGGKGPANQPGLDVYDQLVDKLCAQGITPVATLFHWDLPSELQAVGGWANRDTAHRFADYAALVYERLHDRVPLWVTVNEPRTYAFVGNAQGVHAPGLTDYDTAVAVVHHLLLGHGLATQALRAVDSGATVGLAPDPAPVIPRTDSPEDLEAARRIDGLVNRLFLDPVVKGGYPDDVRADLEAHLVPVLRDGDEAEIGPSVDFLGVNYYRPYLVAAPGTVRDRAPDEQGEPGGMLWPGAEEVRFLGNGEPLTDNGWIIDAEAFTLLLTTLSRDYPGIPLYVTENGAAYNDGPVDGVVADDRRTTYLEKHIAAVGEAIAAGADVRGYFVWSLMDNFEWERGYTQRFGIVHVDFDTQERIPKASALWYRSVIEAHGLGE
jgi:beta-glucosidase